MFLVHTDATVISGQKVYIVRLILMNAKTRATVTGSQVKVFALTTMCRRITPRVMILCGQDTSAFAEMVSKVIFTRVLCGRLGRKK